MGIKRRGHCEKLQMIRTRIVKIIKTNINISQVYLLRTRSVELVHCGAAEPLRSLQNVYVEAKITGIFPRKLNSTFLRIYTLKMF